MGKYMRKAKVSGEVAVMDVSHQSCLGVRTRARTLALQRLQKEPTTATTTTTSASGGGVATSYLQLRSRRLEKPIPPKPKETQNRNPSPKRSSKMSPKASSRANSASVGSVSAKDGKGEASPEADGVVEVSLGENVLEAEAWDRDIRETTPCSLIRDSETIGTPGSTTRPTNSAVYNRRIQNSMRQNIPTAHEMEEFFAGAEQHQQRIFTEKYNFDPVNDHPLPGRFEWVKLDS